MAGSDRVRVVVTGVGVVSPVGIGNESFWNHLQESRSGIDFLTSLPTEQLPSRFGAEIKDFDPRAHLRDRKYLKVMSRDIQLGVAAATLAVSTLR